MSRVYDLFHSGVSLAVDGDQHRLDLARRPHRQRGRALVILAMTMGYMSRVFSLRELRTLEG